MMIIYYVWKSIYTYNEYINGYNFNTMKQYILVSFICNSAFSHVFEAQISKKIKSGNIIVDMLKPVNYKIMLFSKMLGSTMSEYVGAILSAIIFGYLIGAFKNVFIVGSVFPLSLFFSIIIKFEIQYFFSIFCFYTDNHNGVVKAREILSNFFSGALVPLIMFPESIREVLGFSPFAGMVSIPVNIFIGLSNKSDAFKLVCVQLLWIILLHFLSNFFWKNAYKKISVYGG